MGVQFHSKGYSGSVVKVTESHCEVHHHCESHLVILKVFIIIVKFTLGHCEDTHINSAGTVIYMTKLVMATLTQ